MTTLFLIRHAHTDALGQTLSGRQPGIHLSAHGRQQAEKLASALAGTPLLAVYSSPMERALETANPLAHNHGLAVVADDSFNEIDFGAWTGASFEELQRLPEFHRFNTFRSVAQAPGGETMAEAQLRFVSRLRELAARHAGEAVAVVSHSDMIKSAIACFAGIPLDLMLRLRIDPASISVLTLGPDTVAIEQLNYRPADHPAPFEAK